MNDAVQQTGILSAYRDSLEPIYEEICGDRATYLDVEAGFSNYIETQTEPPQSFPHAFRDFLAYGENCHENSLANHMIRNMQSLVIDLKPAMGSAVNGAALFEPFRLFRNAYIELVELIHSLNNSEFISRADENGVAWQIDRTSMMRMWRTANHAEILSSNMLYEVAKKLFEIRSDDFETAVIRVEHTMLRGLSEAVLAFNQGINPAQSYDVKPVIDQIETFEAARTGIMNPLNWAALLFPETMKHAGQPVPKGFGITIHSAHRNEPLQHAMPASLMEFMERIFFVVARTGTPLDISIQSSGGNRPQYDLVISSGHSLDALRKDIAISYLGNILRVRWDTPGLLTSIFTRPFQTLRGLRHSIFIPLQTSGPSQPSSKNGGTHITGFSPAAETNLGHAATILQNPTASSALLMSYGIQTPVNMSTGFMPTMPVILNPVSPIVR